MLSILYLVFAFTACTLFLVLSAVALVITYPFQKSRLVVHWFSRILVMKVLTFLPTWRVRVKGMENLDRKKSYVIVINHQAVVDIPSLYFLPLNFRWVSKREVYKAPFFGQFLFLHGDICINRGNANQAIEQLLREGKLWISRGVSVAIFPEGTRSKDGQIHRFKAGAFILAREANVEILPVVFEGTNKFARKGWNINWRNTVTISVLPPVSVEQVATIEPHKLMNQVRESMCNELQALREKCTK